MSEDLQKKIDEVAEMPLCEEAATLVNLAKQFLEPGASLKEVARQLEHNTDLRPPTSDF